MQVCHTPAAVSVSFDESNLIGSEGLALVMEMAAETNLHRLAASHLTVPTDKGITPGRRRGLGGWHARRSGRHLRHGRGTPRGDEAGLQRLLRALDPGFVPACLQVRARAPTQSGPIPVHGTPGRAPLLSRLGVVGQILKKETTCAGQTGVEKAFSIFNRTPSGVPAGPFSQTGGPRSTWSHA